MSDDDANGAIDPKTLLDCCFRCNIDGVVIVVVDGRQFSTANPVTSLTFFCRIRSTISNSIVALFVTRGMLRLKIAIP